MVKVKRIGHHTEDVDGFTSLAVELAVEALCPIKSFECSLELVPLQYSGLPRQFGEGFLGKDLSGDQLKGKMVIVLDIGADKFLFDKIHGSKESLIERVARCAEIKIWIDHHPSTIERAEEMGKMGWEIYIPEKERCTTLMLCDQVKISDPYLRQLAAIAQLHDYPRTKMYLDRGKRFNKEMIAFGEKLQMIISLNLANGWHDKLHELARRLSIGMTAWWNWSGSTFLPPFDQDLIMAEQIQADAMERLYGSREIIKTKSGLTFAVYLADAKLPQKDTVQAVRKNDEIIADVFVICFGPDENNNWLIHNPGVDFDAEKFLGFMSGGGRAYSPDIFWGGFALSKLLERGYPVSLCKDNFLEFCTLLYGDIQKFLKG